MKGAFTSVIRSIPSGSTNYVDIMNMDEEVLNEIDHRVDAFIRKRQMAEKN